MMMMMMMMMMIGVATQCTQLAAQLYSTPGSNTSAGHQMR
jgi:hypothetical protein